MDVTHVYLHHAGLSTQVCNVLEDIKHRKSKYADKLDPVKTGNSRVI